MASEDTRSKNGKIDRTPAEWVDTLTFGDERPAEAAHPQPEGTQLRPLPAYAQLADELGAAACPLLDQYIAFSKEWSPRSYEDFHEASFLWMLSTVAARRVFTHFGKRRYTNLTICLCARTTVWSKSGAAEIAKDTIVAAGLKFLLTPDDATPQAFISDMTLRLPSNFDELSGEKQEAIRRRLAFAGQRGWYYEEFGQKLSAMMREGGIMADYRGLLRRLDDCPDSYEMLTQVRGNEELTNPYLALLANMTPADMMPHAKPNSALWHDGLFARVAFVTPPPGTPPLDGKFPRGERIIPAGIVQALQAWHQRLGSPEAQITERYDENGKPVDGHTIYVEPAQQTYVPLSDEAYNALYRYDKALREIMPKLGTYDLDGTYGRLAEKALRVALLFASFENSPTIELRHWARAQQITERWRAGIHYLLEQVQGSVEESKEAKLEDKLVQVLGEMGEASVRDIRANHLRAYSTEEIERVLRVLVQNGIVVCIETPRTKKYRLAGGETSV